MSSTTAGVAFGSDESSHLSIVIPILKLLLVLLLLTPLWLTAVYAWQRTGERAHGTLQAWQDATPVARRAVVAPAKALAWAFVHRVRGSMPLQIRQATGGLQGHRLVAADEAAADEAEYEAEGARRRMRATPEPVHAESLARSLAAAAAASAAAACTVDREPMPREMASPLDDATPAKTGGPRCGGVQRRAAREPQVMADAELALAPVVTQEALQVAGGCAPASGGEAEELAAAAGKSLQLAPSRAPHLPPPPLDPAVSGVANVLATATEAAVAAEASAAAAAEAAEAPLPMPPPPPPPVPPPLCPPPVRPPPTETMLDSYDPKKSMGMVLQRLSNTVLNRHASQMTACTADSELHLAYLPPGTCRCFLTETASSLDPMCARHGARSLLGGEPFRAILTNLGRFISQTHTPLPA